MSKTKIIDHGTLSGEMNYVAKTAEEIRQLALDSISGRIFGSWMLRDTEKNLMSCVFMPLLYLNDILGKVIERDGVVHVYGDMSDAVPRAINGLPMFMSIFFLNQTDLKRLATAIDAQNEFMKTDIEGENGDQTSDS